MDNVVQQVVRFHDRSAYTKQCATICDRLCSKQLQCILKKFNILPSTIFENILQLAYSGTARKSNENQYVLWSKEKPKLLCKAKTIFLSSAISHLVWYRQPH